LTRPFSCPPVTSSHHGEEFTSKFRIKYNKGEHEISPWHNIPLKSGDNYNFITEIPKFTKAKMEVTTKEKKNPIAQDLKKGKLRDYHGPIYWNYGCLPQTWENPNVVHPTLKIKGDNDPLDVVEIGSKAFVPGSVTPVGDVFDITPFHFLTVLFQVKILGVLAMIDDGELDWKVLAIATSDPLANKLNDVHDVDTHCPGTVSGKRHTAVMCFVVKFNNILTFLI
jgi:inorganic pyrophosphatase